MVQAVPTGYHRVNIHLTFQDSKKAIDFYQKAFGGELKMLMPGAGGQGVMHAELQIGDTIVFFADDQMKSGNTVESGKSAAFVPHVWVNDADAVWKRAIDAGCKEAMKLENQFWGDRYGQLQDPFGLRWAIGQHVEDVSPDELQKRAAKLFGGA